MSTRLLLVHGLWMQAPALYYWKNNLSKAGFAVEYFSYKSILQSPEQAFAQLREVALAKSNTHILAHSLGGLIAVNALAASEFKGHIICVGTPLRGSEVARQMAIKHVGKLAGQSLPLLCEGIVQIPKGLQVSAIAGTAPHGLGRLMHRFTEPNDGTVMFSETQVDGLARHLTVNASHSGQLFSKEVIQNVLAILASH